MSTLDRLLGGLWNTGAAAWENRHDILDAVGMIPIPLVNEAADGLNAVLYAVEGDYVNVVVSFGAMVPVIGTAATGGKWAKKSVGAATNIGKNVDNVAVKVAKPNGANNIVPNPYGSKGSPAHQEKVKEIVADIKDRGLKPLQEKKLVTPGGLKESRFPDARAIDPETGQIVEVHQVGRVKKDGNPVKRENDAILDIENAPDVPNGVRVQYHKYDY